MSLIQDKFNKQHIQAEYIIDQQQIIPSLSDLFVAHYPDCSVLAVFSSREKKFLGYKITNPVDNLADIEPWLNEDFNSINAVSFTSDYQVTPSSFSNNEYRKQHVTGEIAVNFNGPEPNIAVHYMNALIQFHLLKKQNNQLYIFNIADDYNILLMDNARCLLANTFKCKGENEVLYFLLNTLQVNDLLPSDNTLNIDYSLLHHPSMIRFLAPHFAKTEILRFSFDHTDDTIPQLPEKLFACYAASLCV